MSLGYMVSGKSGIHRKGLPQMNIRSKIQFDPYRILMHIKGFTIKYMNQNSSKATLKYHSGAEEIQSQATNMAACLNTHI